MSGSDFSSCKVMTKSPSWGIMDILIWKLVPETFGGRVRYIQRFKDAWVSHNGLNIRMASLAYKLPEELLAGVCWIEVAGDPNFIDKIAFEVRSFDWSGPEFIDKKFTVTNPPDKTSFGFVSIQLRTAAATLGLDVRKMTTSQLRMLADCIERDSYNIRLVARHLRQLADYDRLPSTLRKEESKIIGARYHRGIKPTLEEIKRNTSYGDFIVRNWQKFHRLVWG